MSYINHCGYGYSKRLCESVTSWFMREYFRHHEIDVEVEHRGLKRECALGYCDVVGSYRKPRKFLIEMQTHLDKKEYTKTLLHELWHVYQWVSGDLKSKRGNLIFEGVRVDNFEYEDQPHEIEARETEETLYKEYHEERLESLR